MRHRKGTDIHIGSFIIVVQCHDRIKARFKLFNITFNNSSAFVIGRCKVGANFLPTCYLNSRGPFSAYGYR